MALKTSFQSSLVKFSNLRLYCSCSVCTRLRRPFNRRLWVQGEVREDFSFFCLCAVLMRVGSFSQWRCGRLVCIVARRLLRNPTCIATIPLKTSFNRASDSARPFGKPVHNLVASNLWRPVNRRKIDAIFCFEKYHHS